MANEILISDLKTNGGAVAEVLSGLIQDALFDATDLRSVCKLVPYSAIGSNVMAVTIDEAPGAFASTGEAASVANSAYTTDEFLLTVSKYARAYELSDLVAIGSSAIDLDRMVSNLSQGVALTMTDLITGTFGSFTNTVGSTGVNLSIDDIYSGFYKLISQLNSGPYTCVLSPTQFNDMLASLRSESGAVQYVPATAEMLASKGTSFRGTWQGCDFYVSDSVPTANAGADDNGLMFGADAIGYTMAPVSLLQGHVPASNILVDAGELLVELYRDSYGGQTAAIATMYPGAALIDNGRGVGIVTDH
jgi:hypothetical protein